MIYAASPKQQIDKHNNQPIVAGSLAWASFVVINIVSFIWLIWADWSILVVAITLLLINMLMIPGCIILLAHKSQWLKQYTLSLICLSALAQLIFMGQSHVA